MSGQYKTYARNNLIFYVTATNQIYFTTNLQTVSIVHAQGIFAPNSRHFKQLAHMIRYNSIQDLNGLAMRCRELQLKWICIKELPS